MKYTRKKIVWKWMKTIKRHNTEKNSIVNWNWMEHWSENGKYKSRNEKKITNMLPINVEPKTSKKSLYPKLYDRQHQKQQ